MQGITAPARLVVAAWLALAFLVVGALSAEAAGYLKFEGIDGESKDKDHKDWIDVLSIDWGASKPSATAPGERLMQPKMGAGSVTVTKRLDNASPALARRKKFNRKTGKVILHAPNPRGGFLKYELKNVMITSVSTAGTGAAATETISLNYQEIRIIPARMQLKPKPERK